LSNLLAPHFAYLVVAEPRANQPAPSTSTQANVAHFSTSWRRT
jgi:hypothetical protein